MKHDATTCYLVPPNLPPLSHCLQVEGWVHEQAQAQLLRDSRRGFLHARFLTLFWGFADDFFISLR